MNSETNPELQLARRLIEQTGTHVFLTGKAGTGKTTFLRTLKAECPKRMIVLAPTGIAAINAGGMTIHSFFQLPFAPYIPGSVFGGEAQYKFQFGREKLNIMRSIDLLVIDEISMVRADLLDAIDDVLRRFRRHDQPFGGVQLLLIGDVQQLPPVAKNEDWQLLAPYYDSPYFFSSHALKATTCCTIELKKVYRQNDIRFLNLLNAIRENRCTADDLDTLNQRYLPDFKYDDSEGYIRLTTHNHQAQQINQAKLNELESKSYRFKAEITGNFPEYNYPTDLELELKKGAQVMFVKNDISGTHRYANGTLGKVTVLTNQGIQVRVNETGALVDLNQEEWANTKYSLDNKTKEIIEEIEGTFKQYPIKLAWAITVHKSQGLTFDKAIIDISGAFAHGQTYVALSRCRTLEGLILSAPLTLRTIISDQTVCQFNEQVRRNQPTDEQCNQMQRNYFIELLRQLFRFQHLEQNLLHYIRIIDEHLYQLYPKQLETCKQEATRFKTEITAVAQKFEQQYVRMAMTSSDCTSDQSIQERIQKAAIYFIAGLNPLLTLLDHTHLETDNKEISQKLNRAYEDLFQETKIKNELLTYVETNGFQVTDFLKKRSLLHLEEEKASRTSSSSKKNNKEKTIGADIRNPKLYKALIEWRNQEAARIKLPVYTVLQQKAILGLTNLMPRNKEELMRTPCIGKKTIDKYGETLISIIEKHAEDGARGLFSGG